MKVKARYIRIGAVALLTLFVAYYAILTLYAHVHEVNGGQRNNLRDFIFKHII